MKNQTFGKYVREARDAGKMTQATLAGIVGIGISYISKIENDAIPVPPSERVIERLAKAMGGHPEMYKVAAGCFNQYKLQREAMRDRRVTAILRALSDGNVPDETIEEMLRALRAANVN